jgi:hypothetical protein
MEKKRNLWVIPTDKPSRLRYNLSNVLVLTKEPYRDYSKQVNQNIYITSDEEIKEGDWYYLPKENKVAKCPKTIKLSGVTPEWTQKIILTTDQDLIKDGVQAIDNEFLEWFVKNPSCEFVETKLVYDYEEHPELVGNPKEEWSYYKIIIPKEEPKQETPEEAAQKQWGNVHRTGVLGFIEGANWQAERMYSEEDLRKAFDAAREFNSLNGVVDVHIVLPMGGDMSDLQPLHFTFKEWFEQFKKQ